MMDFAKLNALTIPEGAVARILAGDRVLWSKNRKLLPEGYTLLDYIEATGTQYIDTSFIPNSNSRMVLDFALTRTGEGTNQIIGGRTHASKNVFAFGANADNIWRYGYGTAYYNAGVCDLNRHSVDANKNVCSIDGVVCYTAPEKSFTGEYSIYIGSVHAQTGSFPGYVRVYSCQLYDSGTLVRNYVPCINPDGEVGMYDRVNGVFYGNSGTGTFTYGHAFVEYIESNGNQYLVTDYYPSSRSRVVADLQFTSTGVQSRVFSALTDAYYFDFYINGSKKLAFNAGTDRGNTATSVSANTKRHLYEIDLHTAKLDGAALKTLKASTGQCSHSLVLFARRTNGGGTIAYLDSPTKARLYSVMAYDSGVLALNLVPCVKADGEIGMYDRVSGVFYGNAGTGAFTYG